MYTLYHVKVYLSILFSYIIFTLDNAEVYYEIKNTRNIGAKRKDKILAVYPAWAKLSKFQQDGEQPDKRNQI